MKILVCISKTPDTTTKINFTEDKKSLNTANVQYIINPNDDHSLAYAIELKQKHNAEITAIHVGDQSSDSILKKCLAIGADKAVRIDSEPFDALFVSHQIAHVFNEENYDLVMSGCESIDFNGAQLCHQLGAIIEKPSFSYVTDFEINDNKAKLSRNIDGGSEKISVQLPIVISATKELAEPKIPNMRGIMQARSKPIDVKSPVDLKAAYETISFEPPKEKGQCKLIDPSEAEKLIDILHNEAKII